MRIYLQIDRDNDQFYFGFGQLDKPVVAQTVRINDDVCIDLDEENHLLGVDVGRASTVLDGDLREIQIDQLLGVAEAARLVGANKGNFIRDYANKPAFPKPVVALASGRIWLRSQIEDFVATRDAAPSARRRRQRTAVS